MFETLHATNGRCGTKPYKARTGASAEALHPAASRPSRHVAKHPLDLRHQDHEAVRHRHVDGLPGERGSRNRFVPQRSRSGMNSAMPGAGAGA